jgi:hypothetical protein
VRRIVLSVLVVLTSLSGCGWFGSSYLKDNEKIGIPLSVRLDLDPSVTGADLEFIDPCQQRRTFPLGESLTSILTRQMGLTFEQIHTSTSPPGGAPIDGTLRIELGFKELELFIARQASATYPATVSLGGTATYTDSAGTSLFSKKLRAEISGSVETDGVNCEVKGLAELANETAAKLTQGFKKNLADSAKIKRTAAGRKPGSLPVLAASSPPSRPGATATVPAPAAAAPQQPVAAVPTLPAIPAAAQPTVPASPLRPDEPPRSAESGPPTLSFRALLRDENRDNVLMGGEPVTVEVEVTNTGTQPAKDVAITFSGSPVMVQAFAKPVLVGDLSPGESRRIKVAGKMGDVTAAEQAELVIGLSTATSGTAKVVRKKFIASVRPAEEEEVEVLSVDVDRTPKRVRGYERHKAVGVAIGVGSFRDPDVAELKFAAHDAEVMARYFQTVGGISTRRIKVMTDDHALKEDIAEALEEWLPQQVEEGGTVMVFFSGRAVADPATGAILLFPHEGSPGATAHLFSLRRLQAVFAKLPVEHAVLLLDVTLTEPPDPGPVKRKKPIWAPLPALMQDGKLVQMIGSTEFQHAHEYPKGKHGLFTYYLLKGLAGDADEDRNGIVAMGELFEYVRDQVMETARADFGNEQEPMCIPGLGPNESDWTLPLARIR